MAAFTLNQADLAFVLFQIKVAEAHAAGIPLTKILLDANGQVIANPLDPAYGPNFDAVDPNQPLAIPDPLVPVGLRTVDGTDNNIVPGRETWGAADQSMPRLLDASYTSGVGTADINGPAPGGETTGGDYSNPANTIVDTAPRTISNLIVDMSLNNPAAIIAALTFAGSEDVLGDQAAISAAFEALKQARDTNDVANIPALEAALDGVLEAKGVTVNNGSIDIPNVAPDEGLSAPFNAWMTFFGQFFDHGLDLIAKGGTGVGTVFVPLEDDDPLVTHGPDGVMNTGDEVPPQLRFMTLTRATPTDDGSQTNTTTPFVDQNQTYTSHASHQVFLREYAMVGGVPVATGRLLTGEGGGLATWADVKAQAAEMLGIQLTDGDVLNIPLIQTDPYGEFIRGANGLPQLVRLNPDGTLHSLIEGDLGNPVNTFSALAARIGHAFLDDIAHNANPLNSNGTLKVADGDGELGLATLVDGFQSVDLTTGAPGVNVDAALGNWTLESPDGWAISGFGGTFDPTPTVISETGHGGGNVVFLDSGAILARDTGVLLQTGRTYSLTFNVGDRTDQGFGGGIAELVTTSGTVLSSITLPVPADGAWTSVSMNTGPIAAISNGEQLRIEIRHAGSGQVLVDDVKLTSNVPQYDNELLDRHYITGDGRGNENIGLTAVHHIFHSEHNRQVDSQKLTILQSGNLSFVNEWLAVDIDAATLTAFNDGFDAAGVDKGAYLAGNALFNGAGWDGERLFQAARFATEMQYQHLVFEEFGRKIQPTIDPFVFNAVTDINPAIFAEFANTVYRFGHSMLTENMPRIDADGNPMDPNLGLVEAFLNPVLFDQTTGGVSISHDEGAAAIVRGMTIERGNEIDEFVVDALRNNLLGLPLDLAAINIARGRDTGIPSLNDAREQLYAASGSTFLKPYDHWADFAANLKNPASIVNFIAAYGTHHLVTDEGTLEGKRAAAMELVFGEDANGNPSAVTDRIEFLTGTGDWAGVETGLNLVDLWIGGLAEKKMPFGGFLGSTFNAVFELQMENLQDGDRFYYLTRTQGQNFLNALEQNSFAKMIMANTSLADAGPDGIRGTSDDIILRHIGVDVFATYDYVLEVNVANQADYDPDNLSASGKDPTGNDPFLEAIGFGKVIRNDPGTLGPDNNYIRVFGGEHTVVGGTDGNDTIITDFGDDGIWGDAGDDRIESGAGVDLVNGGAGNDIITDSGDSGDFLKGDEGDDVIANSNGLDVIMGGSGKDVVFVGVDATEVFGGSGDDFILGGDDVDFLLGNEGDDWMEAGAGFDTTAGDNSELFFNSAIKGHDVMFAGSDEHDFDAESGDDIMVQGESVMRNEGMFGFDWSIYKGVAFGADADLRVPIFTTEAADILRNRFDKVEALSGWDHADILRGDDRVTDLGGGATIGTAEGVFFQDELTQAGVDRIDGLRDLLGNLIDAAVGTTAEQRELEIAFNAGNILLGGGGSDLLQGNGGNDFIDGDAWLNVRIRITGPGQDNTQLNQISTVDSLNHVFTASDAGDPSWIGKSLFELMISRTIVPNQLHIVREIIEDDGAGDIDVAVFNDVLANYTITTNLDGTVTVTQNAVTVGVIDPLTGRNLVSDNVDTLRNIEVARFANNVEVVLGNVPALGTPAISDTTPTENQVLTADTSGISDLNGLGAFSFQWQASTDGVVWTDVGADSDTFAPAQAQVGQQIRVVVSFTDGLGTLEQVTSAATAAVEDSNLPVTGSVVVSDLTPTEGQQLTIDTSTIADANGLGAFSYQWQQSANGTTWTNIAGATNPTFTPQDISILGFNGLDAQAGLQLRVAVSFLDGGGTVETLFSAPTGPTGANWSTLFGAGFNGTAGDDTASGGALANTLNGNAGDDILSGNGGNDVLNGGAGNDTLNGGGGGADRAVYAGAPGNFNFAQAGGNIVVTDLTGAEGTDTLNSIEQVTFGGTTYTVVVGNSGVANRNDLVLGFAGDDNMIGNSGNDVLVGGAGNDSINAGAGNDEIMWRVGDGTDFMNGGINTDTAHFTGTAGVAEHFRLYTRVEALAAGIAVANGNTEIVITRDGTTTASVIAELDNIEEIVINGLGGGDTFTPIGDFTGTSLALSTITVNGGEGDDTVDITSLLSAHRILFRSNGGEDTIIGALRPQDVIELTPGTTLTDYVATDNGDGTTTYSDGTNSVTFASAGTPTIQETPPSMANAEGVSGAFEYTPSDLAGLKALVNGQQPAQNGDDDVPTGVRTLSGEGNNEANPTWGSADQAFIRITNSHYGEPDADGNRAVNPIFDGLDPRTISNILGAQEAGLPVAGNDANIFFMAMGQYIDHGLDFLPKGGNGSIPIGGVGGGDPFSGNPADLTRGTVIGHDADGNPLHKNQTSPYVDQNQAYGSHNLVGQFLRESDGDQGYGMRLFSGAPDPSNPDFNLLPTLRELIQHHWQANTIFADPDLPGGQISFRAYYTNYQIDPDTTGTLFDDVAGAFDPGVVSKMISNFMGSGHPLLLDTNPFINVLDHYVVGDCRGNENFALTSIHTIWARNHNHHVDGLLAAGFEGTAEEVFQAAKMINEAEYQRVVFDEYLETLLGGLRSEGTHGFEEYDPNANAAISHEFAAAAFRFGHSLIGQKLTVLDAGGNPVEVNLFDAFLNPSNDPAVFESDPTGFYTPQPGYAQYGVNAIVGGNISQPSEAVDFNIVDAVRNDLVRISADLFAFNVARGWDVGLGTLNQIRMDLAASTDPYVSAAVGFAGGNLSAYTSWEDFQARNGLSNAVIAQFKQAYPDLVLAAEDIAAFQAINPDIQLVNGNTVKGIDRVDFWVGGLAEAHINGGIVGETFWVVLSEQFERLQDADRYYYISRFDDFDFYENFIDGQEFADIVARNTGMTDLPEHMFRTDEIDNQDDDDDDTVGNDDDNDDDTVGNDDDDQDDTDDDDDDDTVGNDDDDDDQDDDDTDDDDDDDDTVDNDDDCGCDDDDDNGYVPPPASGPGPNIIGTIAADVLLGTSNDDTMIALEGHDNVIGGDGADVIRGGDGNDFLSGQGGRDVIFGGAGADDILGGAGKDMLYGDGGHDRIFGNEGDDLIDAGTGDDTVYGGAGDDVIIASVGDGSDVYYGDEMSDCVTGNDTLDMSAITANITADLGTGFLGKGSVSSSQTGTDTIWSIENIITGSGNDTITASKAVNVMDGGAGNDTFRFLSAADANGDTIMGFQPGDKIDLSAIDANTTSSAHTFTLVPVSGFNVAGALSVVHETRDGEDFTIVQGNTNGGSDAEFKLNVKGHHNLTADDFNL